MSKILRASYLQTLPPLPPLDVQTVDGTTLVKSFRGVHLLGTTLGCAAGAQITPVAVFKYGDGGCDFRSSEGFVAAKKISDSVELLADNWPEGYNDLKDKYIWLNSLGEMIAPRFDCRANILAEPGWVLASMLETWKIQTIDKMKAVVWLPSVEGRLVQVHARHIPLMILSILPYPLYTEAIMSFPDLGQGFMRYCFYYLKRLNETYAKAIMLSLVVLPRFGTYGTSEVLINLRAELEGVENG